MASKTVDVDLRIRAQNLSKATLGDIASDIDRISKAQQEQAKTSAALTARTREEIDADRQYLAMAQQELARRQKLVESYKGQRAEVVALAQRIREMTAVSRQAAQGQAFGDPKQFRSLTKEIASSQAQLQRLVSSVERSGQALAAAGIDANKLDVSLGELNSASRSASNAQLRAVADLEQYSAAATRQNQISAEAVRRLDAETAARLRLANTAVASRNRSSDLAALRKDIQDRSEQARVAEVQAEASRRLQAQTEQETSARLRAINAIVAEKNRAAELAALRRDIEQRSASTAAATNRETEAQARSNARRERLVALLNSERGARLRSAQELYGETKQTNENTAAKDRNAQATGRAARQSMLFNDVGRKSLSTYQRLRGQILSLAAAYVGVFQAINTVRDAIEATNRDQALRAGLLTGTQGDQAQATKNYKMLRAEADRLGLVFDDVAPKFVNLDIAGRAAGLTANQTAAAFRNLSQSAAARNLSLDDTQGAFRAIEQMFSKGKVQAEELRGQLAERLPGAVAIFARANNMTLAQLDKALEKGQVGLDFVVKGLEAYAQQFDGQMGIITERLSAYINRARNSYNDWLRTLLDSNNQSRLKTALQVLTDFFQSKDGEKFAQDLGKALAVVIDTFILLAKNMDTVMLLIKGFLALQVVKFFADMALSIGGAAAALTKFAAATRAAAAGTGAMSVAARGLTVLFGPLGVAVAAVGGIFAAYANGVANAEKRTLDFIDTLHKARNVQSTLEADKAQRDLNDQYRDSEEQLKKLVKLRDDAYSLNPIKNVVAAAKGLNEDVVLRSEYEDRINEELAKQAAIQANLETLQKRRGRLAAEEAEQARKASMETVPTTPAADKAAKVPKGPDPESVRDRIVKMTEDLRAKLAQVETQSNARTAAQIEQNYQSRLAIIKTEIAKAEVDIAAMQRAAAKSNKGKGTDVTTELTTLKGALEAYRQAAVERAEEEKTVANITLQEQELQKLIDMRASKLQLINTLQENGAITTGEAWSATFSTLEEQNAKIRTQVEEFLAMLQAIDPNSDLYVRLGVDKLIAGLQQTRAEAEKTAGAVKRIGLFLANDVANGAANALVTLGQGLAGAIRDTNSLGDAFKGATDQFRNFAADFLQNIAQMIIQALILQAIQNAINGTSGGYGAAIGAVFKVGTKHQGGMVGGANRTNATRMVSAGAMLSAGRFHNGGLPGLASTGLKSNEVPTILEVGEEVITADDPRHANNGGMVAGGGTPNVTVQNNVMLDSVEVVQNALARPEGSKELFSWISSNRSGVRSALGV